MPFGELPDQAQALVLIKNFLESREVLKASERKHLAQVVELLLSESKTKGDSLGVALK